MIQDEITPCTRMTMSPINRDLLVVIIAVASGLMLLFFASYAHAEPKADLTNTAISSARLYWESKLAFFAPKGVLIPHCRKRLSRRNLCGSEELDRESLSQTDLLQSAPERRPLRSVGTTATLL